MFSSKTKINNFRVDLTNILAKTKTMPVAMRICCLLSPLVDRTSVSSVPYLSIQQTYYSEYNACLLYWLCAYIGYVYCRCFCLADLLVRSPWILYTCIIQIHSYLIKVSVKHLIQFGSQNHRLLHPCSTWSDVTWVSEKRRNGAHQCFCYSWHINVRSPRKLFILITVGLLIIESTRAKKRVSTWVL